MIDHRYTVIRKLGEGGSAAVYLVQDRLRGDEFCALKVFHPRAGPDEQGDRTFRNEVSALINLHHPGLVQVFDFGTIRHDDDRVLAGRLFLSMEYVRGTDILALAKAVGDKKEQARLMEALMIQALSVLSYVHSEGVIHFDIKPQNLVVLGSPSTGPAPFLKLVDFGLSAGRDLSQGGLVRGTLQYAAPELLQGAAVDHRADLYSLGATFYRLIEDRCPFEAPDSVELVKKILGEDPAFSEAADLLPPRLIRVIRRLLQKDPAERFENALEAARALSEGQGEERRGDFSFAQRSRFVGRQADRDRIAAALAQLASGSGPETESAVIVTGAAGMGKSEFLEEMAKTARARGLPVAKTEVLHGDFPFHSITPVLQILASEARLLSEEGRALVDRHLGVIEKESGNKARAVVDRLVFLRARFIRECSRLFPFVIVADDLTGLDDASRQVLQTVAREAPAGRIMIIASEATPQEGHPGLTDATEIRLQELSAAEIEEMCDTVLGSRPGVKILAREIHTITGGVPAVAAHALRTIAETAPGDALRDESAAEEFVQRLRLSLPATLEEFFARRFHQVSREQQLLLSVISCFSHPAPLSAVAAVLPIQPERLNTLATILEFDGYVGSLDNHRRCFIRLQGLKRMIYDSIAVERSELHAAIAGWMSCAEGPISFADLQELAHQYRGAGNQEAASEYSEKAADEGMRLFAHQRAVGLYTSALSGGPHASARDLEIRRKLSGALYHAGQYEEAVSAAEEALRSPGLDPLSAGDLEGIIGLAQSRLGEFESARAHLLKALKTTADPVAQIEIRQELVGINISVGQFREAEQESLQQLEKARQFSRGQLEAPIFIDLGIATFLQNRYDDSILYFHRAMDAYSRLEDYSGVINAMMNLGNVLNAKGETERALVFWNDGLKMSEEHGTLNQQAQLQNNLGIAHYGLKNYEEAKLHYGLALDLFKRIHAKSGRAYALSNLGETLLAAGEYEPALQAMSEARSLYVGMGDSRGIAETALLLAQLWLVFGNLDAADRSLKEARDVPAESRDPVMDGQMSYLRGLVLSRRGEFAEARDAFVAANAGFEASGEKTKAWKCAIASAESLVLSGKFAAAPSALAPFLKHQAEADPQLRAEALFVLGNAERGCPGATREKPIVLFKKAMAALEHEHVSEITWKIALALAREYHQRGQRMRSKEYLLQARLILNLFLSHITSQELKAQYLSTDERQHVLSTTESLLYT